MGKRNWSEYNKRLVQRGSLTFLMDPKVMKTLAPKAEKKRKGRPLTSKCAKGLSTNLRKLSSSRPKTVVVDATGIKVQGEGEWKVKVHGKGRPRKWIKLHVAIDEWTQEIVGEISIEAIVDDGKEFAKVMRQVKRRPKNVIGDGAYDDRDVLVGNEEKA